jgi:hypothetical protein
MSYVTLYFHYLAQIAFEFAGGMFAVWLVHQVRKFWRNR